MPRVVCRLLCPSLFCTHVGFLEGPGALSKKQVEHIFVESQNERFPADSQVSFMQEMVLVEFMEGACRAANDYWPHTVGSIDVKVDMLVDLLQRLLQKLEVQGDSGDDD